MRAGRLAGTKTWSLPATAGPIERVPCPLCGADDSSPRLRCDGFSYAECSGCGLVYQRERPSWEALRRRYGAEYFSYELSNEENFFNLMLLGLADVRFEEATATIPGPRTFLDVGCATGMLVAWMRDKGWEARGVDICRESAEHGARERGVRIHVGTLEEARFPDRAFSVVHFSHLIEHLPDPRSFMGEVRRVLRDDGYALLTTPNIDGFQARLFGPRWRSAIADHVALFSRKTLRRLLSDSGFTALELVTWGGLAEGTAPRWIKRPADRLAKSWGFGDVMMALCRKSAPGGPPPH